MKFWVGVFTTLLVVAPTSTIVTEYETFVREVEVQLERVDTPAATSRVDSKIDWDEVERQSDCLWKFIQQNDIEITLENVLTLGDYSDMMGGACLLIGEDDE